MTSSNKRMDKFTLELLCCHFRFNRIINKMYEELREKNIQQMTNSSKELRKNSS